MDKKYIKQFRIVYDKLMKINQDAENDINARGLSCYILEIMDEEEGLLDGMFGNDG